MRDVADSVTRPLALGVAQTMTVGQAAGLFSSGVVDGWEVERLDAGGWRVKLRASKQGVEWLLRAVKAKEGDFRVFQSLDAAVSAVESCGFKVPFVRGGA
ncbi:hypothetical protein KTE60_30625 [Burkholderia multivorans]|uniref:hypothetical protein n=1 Tax=Burkholderia multivorans TaxID=87883 RepID=UPI001C218C91|nr:hypothetical protein [Burkholderia multivorans]MBU9633637.1 hypothetical protein [Burkholderia multivorans]MBU9633647.1 hypothetical protein [Burkholderia multivorans]